MSNKLLQASERISVFRHMPENSLFSVFCKTGSTGGYLLSLSASFLVYCIVDKSADRVQRAESVKDKRL